MSNNNASAAQLAARAIVTIAAWPNDQRRDGINPRTQQPFNDGHLNVKVQLNTIKLADILAAALGKGELSIEISGSLWTNDDVTENQPCISGNANMTREMIEARKLEKAKHAAANAASLAAALQTQAPTDESTAPAQDVVNA